MGKSDSIVVITGQIIAEIDDSLDVRVGANGLNTITVKYHKTIDEFKIDFYPESAFAVYVKHELYKSVAVSTDVEYVDPSYVDKIRTAVKNYMEIADRRLGRRQQRRKQAYWK